MIIWIGPPIATALAGFLGYLGLRESSRYSWLRVTAALAILAAICFWLFVIASFGQIAPVAALIVGFLCAFIAIICGLWLIWKLKTWRKVAALVLGLAFPISMFYSIQAGMSQSPEDTTQRNGDAIVQALYRYQAETGHFPPELTSLEPTFLTTLPEALTTQRTGWLYESTDNDFTLGYWFWPDRFASTVCLYSSSAPSWECDLNNWGPFQAVPTPMSCKRDDGKWVDTADCK